MTSFSRTAHLQQVMLSCRMFAGGGLGHLATSVLHWFHGETTRKLHLYLLMDLSTMCLNDTLAAFQLLGFFSPWRHFPKEKIQQSRSDLCGFLFRPPPNVERCFRYLSATATAAPRGSRAFHPPGNQPREPLNNLTENFVTDHLSHRFESGVGKWGESWTLKQWIHQSNTLQKRNTVSPIPRTGHVKTAHLFQLFLVHWHLLQQLLTYGLSKIPGRKKTQTSQLQFEKRANFQAKQSKSSQKHNFQTSWRFFQMQFQNEHVDDLFFGFAISEKKKAVELRLLHHRILLELLDFNSMLLHVQVHLLCSERLKQIFKKDDTRIVSSFCLLKWCLLKL